MLQVSRSRRGVFKVHYVDHSKTLYYVPAASAVDAADHGKYRSYLSLMPEDGEEREAAGPEEQQVEEGEEDDDAAAVRDRKSHSGIKNRIENRDSSYGNGCQTNN